MYSAATLISSPPVAWSPFGPSSPARLWTPEIAAKYESLYESKGVTFHRSTKVVKIVERDGRAVGVEIEGGTVLEADVVVVGVGAGAPTAPFDQLDSTPEKHPGGIRVDATFAASGPGVQPKSVYAIGDVAAFPLNGGDLVRMEHVAHARASAAHAAAAVMDPANDAPYTYLPYFYSRVFEHPGSARKVAWVFYGANPADAEVVVVGDFAPKLAAFWVKEGKAVGYMLESGSPDENAAVAAAAKATPAVDVAALRSAGTVEDALKVAGA